jgi:hypothetical protein
MAAESVEPGSMDELVRVAVLALRYQGAPKAVLAHDMSTAGLSPVRIAQLIDTSPNAVSQYKRQPRPQWPKKEDKENTNG